MDALELFLNLNKKNHEVRDFCILLFTKYSFCEIQPHSYRLQRFLLFSLCLLSLYEYTTTSLIHPTVSRHLSCFLLFGGGSTVMNKIPWTFLYMSFVNTCVSLGYIPRSGTVGSLDKVTEFSRYCQFFKVAPLSIPTSNE